MTAGEWALGLSTTVSQAAPVLLASLGETVAERAGVVNLSLNGVVVLSAMVSFAAAQATGSPWAGWPAGMAVGAAAGALVAASGAVWGASHVAVGLILSFLFRDLAYFLGTPFTGVPGPVFKPVPVPALSEIPLVGPALFSHDISTYLAVALVFCVSVFFSHTRVGLSVRAAGESIETARLRGIPADGVRLAAAVCGGAVSGLAGPACSLATKPGWNGTLSGLDGIGWIALAIVVFGRMRPLRVAFGAWLFAFLQWSGIKVQELMPDVPAQVVQVAPFPLMILTLAIAHALGGGGREPLLSRARSLFRRISAGRERR